MKNTFPAIIQFSRKTLISIVFYIVLISISTPYRPLPRDFSPRDGRDDNALVGDAAGDGAWVHVALHRHDRWCRSYEVRTHRFIDITVSDTLSYNTRVTARATIAFKLSEYCTPNYFGH